MRGASFLDTQHEHGHDLYNGGEGGQRKMKKKKSIPIFSTFSLLMIFFFFWIVEIHAFIQANIFTFPKIIQLSDLIKRSGASEALTDKCDTDAIISAKVKYVEFLDSAKYNSERNIVYKIMNMAESEKYSEGSMKKAVIRIALEDLNDDGVKEILAYIIQFEYCGKGGGYCTFVILQRNSFQSWRELFKISTYPDIGISNAKDHGFHDLFFRNIVFRIVGKEKVRDKQEIIIWRWDGKRYIPFIKSEAIYDPKTKMEKKTVMKWDVKSSSWVE